MLNKRDRLPLYWQLKRNIEARIDAGELRPGMQVPSERELCEQFRISRITVRQALAELVTDGRLARIQGKGTYVAQPRIAQQLTHLSGFTEDMRARGRTPGARVLQFALAAAAPAALRALGLPEAETRAIVVRRLRTADGEPVAIETACLHPERCAGVLGRSIEDRSLYGVLAEACGILPLTASQTLEATECPAAEARMLGVRKGAPVLHIQRVTFTQAGQPFEAVESYYRGDKYVFHAELRADRAHTDISPPQPSPNPPAIGKRE